MKKFLSLLSGGFDSPIASYLMIKKDYTPIFLSFLTSVENEIEMKNQIVKIIKILKKFTHNNIKLYLINHKSHLELFKQKCNRKLTCILCKRLMLRIAKKIGKIEGTNLIVTGDILGEQASQTLDNLYAYNDIIKDFVILRPLIGFDKLEIMKMNKKIGLYTIISQNLAGCQNYPQFPETHAKIEEVIVEESKIELKNIIKKSLEILEILIL